MLKLHVLYNEQFKIHVTQFELIFQDHLHRTQLYKVMVNIYTE